MNCEHFLHVMNVISQEEVILYFLILTSRDCLQPTLYSTTATYKSNERITCLLDTHLIIPVYYVQIHNVRA